ncbi:hypothetical protein PIROE2DRAFT_5882 [Piromyces sp. E2]|nr:hypothetical protein PIROE2DRAFT_5882 [Piromyces sp. E2]|eukprot:OUM66786.1 hypothetical protein PIROE2DRAFT_5882 [Piromyces sp. E2]
MYLIKLKLIPILYSLSWIFKYLIYYSNAKYIEINDFDTFEKNLNNCKSNGNLDFLVKKNITVVRQIELKCNKNASVNIMGSDNHIFINQNFKKESVKNYMINILDIGGLYIQNVNINGNINIEEGENIKLKNITMMGDTSLKNINKEVTIDNVHFKINNEVTDGHAITFYKTKTSFISNCIFDTSTKVNQVIQVEDCNNIKFYNIKMNGSLNKMTTQPILHRAIAIRSSNCELKNVEMHSFGNVWSKYMENINYSYLNGYMISCVDSVVTIWNIKIYNGYGTNVEPITINNGSSFMINDSTLTDLYSTSDKSIISNNGSLEMNGCKIINNNYDKMIFNNLLSKNGYMIK